MFIDFKEKGRKRERKRNIHVKEEHRLVGFRVHPKQGSATYACALTRDGICHRFILRDDVLEPPGQSWPIDFFFNFYIDFRVGKGEKKRNTDLLLHLSMHSLVDSPMCPDWGSNPQPWHIRTTL